MKTRIWEIARVRTAKALGPAFCLVALFLQLNSAAATLTVSNLNDNGSGSLRNAIAASAPGDTIVFAAGLAGTIALANGGLTIQKNLSIIGPGANALTVLGSFSVSNGTVNISGLSVTGSGGGAFSLGLGAVGVYNGATLQVSNCEFSGQFSVRSTDAYQYAFNPVLINYDGTMTLNNCAIDRNGATAVGNNGSALGSAIWNGGTMTLLNCTVSGNFLFGSVSPSGPTEIGLAIYNFGNLTLNCCTIASNYCSDGALSTGGGIYNFGGIVSVANSIIAENLSAPPGDCYGPFISQGYNLIANTNGSTGFGSIGDQLGSTVSPLDPMLGPLQNNGGTTPTHALLSGSPAIDAGNSFGVTTDQRGKPRPVVLPDIPEPPGGDGSDIGAYELNPPVLSIARSSTNALLSWPIVDGGTCVLQSNASLTAPGGWTAVPGTPGTNGSLYVITNSASAGVMFFRLKW